MEEKRRVNGTRGSGMRFLRFFIPSALGVVLFLIPFHTAEGVSLIINMIIDQTKRLMGPALVPFVIGVLTISAVCTVIGSLKKELFHGYWKKLFCVKGWECALRIAAAVTSYLICLRVGPEWLWSDQTGTMMMTDVVANLIPFFLWAGIFLPLLTEFGLMEFVGSLMQPVMRPLFKLPGRSAVNCAVSWVGSGTMGIVLTNQEFEKGYYTVKEAASISTGFSIASIAIVSLLCGFLDMTGYFPLIYICCIVVGLVMNMIMIRIPPIRLMSSSYYSGAPSRDHEEKRPEGTSLLGYAVNAAMDRADVRKGNLLTGGLKVTGDIWFTLEPMVLVIGTAATILAEYTPVLNYLSIPLAGLLKLLGIPEAAAAGQSMLLGFVDIFLPFITGAAIHSQMTKFILSVVCVLQILFITETVPLLLKVRIGMKFWNIVLIFIIRTVLALVLITPVAMLLF